MPAVDVILQNESYTNETVSQTDESEPWARTCSPLLHSVASRDKTLIQLGSFSRHGWLWLLWHSGCSNEFIDFIDGLSRETRTHEKCGEGIDAAYLVHFEWIAEDMLSNGLSVDISQRRWLPVGSRVFVIVRHFFDGDRMQRVVVVYEGILRALVLEEVST